MAVEFGKWVVSAAAVLGALAGMATGAQAALTITWGTTTNVHCSGGVCVSTNADAVLGIKDLQRRLASGNLTVVADSLAYDIAVDGSFSWTSAHSLELFATHAIRVGKTIDVAGPGALTLTSNDNLSDGRLSFGPKGNVHFWSTANALTINGAPYTLVNSLPSLIGTLAAHPTNNVALAADYDATPDGTYTSVPIKTDINGTLEGLGHAISHLVIQPPAGGQPPVGLINLVKAGATVSNLRLTASQFRARYGSNVGGIVISNKGTLVGDTVQGTFTANDNVYMGGITWGNDGTIRDCHTNVQMNAGEATLGGVAANNFSGVIEDSSAKGVIIGTGYDRAGGLVGSNGATVRRSWSSVAVMVGATTGTLRSSGGGLAGVNADFDTASNISDSYATGSVTGSTRSWIGGLVGGAGYTGAITSSYSTGTVSTGSSGLVGGFVGNVADAVTFSDDYWDTDTSGVSNPHQGAGHPANEPGITGLTGVQLKSGLPAGFSSAIWAEDPGIHGRLPYLLSNPPL